MTKRIHSCVVGLGEVGSGLKKALEEKYDVGGVDVQSPVPDGCEYLNICIPYGPNFLSDVNGYVEKLKPKLTINHSTVPVGTTKGIKGCAVHSPVRGKHPEIYSCLKEYIKFIGYNDDEGFELAVPYLSKVMEVAVWENSNTTEYMKLASLAKYLVYLATADEVYNLGKKLGVPYSAIKAWDESQNEVIDNFYENMRWPILKPPKGEVGGHCVMPVSKMFCEEAINAKVDAKTILSSFQKYENLALHEHI